MFCWAWKWWNILEAGIGVAFDDKIEEGKEDFKYSEYTTQNFYPQ
jgi:hypothetical protein